MKKILFKLDFNLVNFFKKQEISNPKSIFSRSAVSFCFFSPLHQPVKHKHSIISRLTCEPATSCELLGERKQILRKTKKREHSKTTHSLAAELPNNPSAQKSLMRCAVCCVLCAVCCVLCAVCCVLCAACCVLCAVHCALWFSTAENFFWRGLF